MLLLVDLKRSMPAGPIMSLNAVNALFVSSDGRFESNKFEVFISENALNALFELLVSTGRFDSNMSGVLISAKALKPCASFALLMLITWLVFETVFEYKLCQELFT